MIATSGSKLPTLFSPPSAPTISSTYMKLVTEWVLSLIRSRNYRSYKNGNFSKGTYVRKIIAGTKVGACVTP